MLTSEQFELAEDNTVTFIRKNNFKSEENNDLIDVGGFVIRLAFSQRCYKCIMVSYWCVGENLTEFEYIFKLQR